MADHRDDTALAPAKEPVRADYMRDFYSWLIEQARLIREGRWDAIDRDNLAEEIESLGREQFNKLESALRVLLVHMLKWITSRRCVRAVGCYRSTPSASNSRTC